ncbi:hypothetical protein EDC04DRAFT_858620 [Pisolithus marmoratus]|nr:hypothetical protein EDC04DRAFT_858620 [Pisolithus marmoratus]
MGVYDETLGTLLVGIFFNTYLYGVVSYQFAAYYQANFNDRLPVKCMVLFLFLLDTFHSIAVIYMAWLYTVTNYANPAVLQYAPWPYNFTPIGTAFAAFVTHIFLGDRIYRLTHSKVLFGIVIAMALPTFVLGFVCGVEAWIIKLIVDMPRIDNLATAWLAMQMSVDIFITGTLSIVLSRTRTGWPATDSVVRRLIRGAIQTGLFASIFSLGDLITFLVLPYTNLYGMFAIPVGRIYSNTLMDTLLVREKLKSQMSSGAFERTSRMMGWVPGPPTNPRAAATSIHFGVHRSLQDSADAVSVDGEQKNVPGLSPA